MSVNVLDHDAGLGADDSIAFQNAFDAAAILASTTGAAEVYVPQPRNSQGYNFETPFFADASNVSIRGDKTMPVINAKHSSTLIYIGQGRGSKANGRPTQAHWVDAYGHLDTVA